MRFAHLHVHSHYSLLDSPSKIPDLVRRAKELGIGALALTDHDNMFGAITFYEECMKQGVKPIIGIEVTVDGNHLTLLAENMAGYKNLLKIATAARN